MRIKATWTPQASFPSDSRMARIDPLRLVALIFGGVGILFAAIGAVCIAISREKLPKLADAAVWLGETPDELAVPAVGVVFAAIGGFFVILALAMLLVGRRQRRLHEELLTYGERAQGRVAGLPVDTSITVNGRHPLRVMVEVYHPRTCETLTLKGPRLWQTSLSVGDPIDVLFDPMDEKRYVVDYRKEEQA